MRSILLCTGLLLSACGGANGTAQTMLPEREVRLVSGQEVVRLTVEMAEDEPERARGLMFRRSLPEGTGMLFVFDEERPLAFWMKNTLIPLDVLYFGADRRFVSVLTMHPCESEPCQTYPSSQPAQYALEVPAGSAQQWGVGEGWELRW